MKLTRKKESTEQQISVSNLRLTGRKTRSDKVWNDAGAKRRPLKAARRAAPLKAARRAAPLKAARRAAPFEALRAEGQAIARASRNTKPKKHGARKLEADRVRGCVARLHLFYNSPYFPG